jgi:hypothetical protein
MGTPDLKRFHPFTTDADGESWVKYTQVEAELNKARIEAFKEAAKAACIGCRLGEELHCHGNEVYYHGTPSRLQDVSPRSRCDASSINFLISEAERAS